MRKNRQVLNVEVLKATGDHLPLTAQRLCLLHGSAQKLLFSTSGSAPPHYPPGKDNLTIDKKGRA